MTNTIQNQFATITPLALEHVTGGKKKGKEKGKSVATPMGPSMQGSLTKAGFQFAVSV